MKRLSIIIPAYNVAQYITRCIESCEKQLIQSEDLEIIFVDDGSTDNTFEVVQTLQEKYSNIIYQHQENAGQATARNKGLSLATSNYIWFVDADDYLTDDGVQELLDIAYRESLDVQAFDLQFVDDDGNCSPFYINNKSSERVMNGHTFFTQVSMPHSPCIALFRKQFLIDNHLLFKEGLYFEDFELTSRLYCLADRASYNAEVHYNYYQRTGSTMKSTDKQKNIKRSIDLLHIADSLYSFAQVKLKEQPESYQEMLHHVAFAVSQSLSYYSKEAYPISDLKSRPYYPLKVSPNTSKNERLKLRVMNYSLAFYLLLLKLKK